MCGINGFILNSTLGHNDLKYKISKMNDLIIHRGPDDQGSYLEIHSEFSVAMAMRRLAIIDLKTGVQPQYSANKENTIVFNGEIYNYKKLRQSLESRGIEFFTNSDTEVILKLYEVEGVQSFSKLDGMFAFSIYDKKRKKIIIARDFFGEKPLYYTNNSAQFVWSSELKSLVSILNEKPKINKNSLNLFFRLTYIPSPYSIYEDIHKLMPNHFLEYDISQKKVSTHAINKPEKHTKKTEDNFETAKKKVLKLVEESVESRSVSDVPLGTFLSGGVDSSIVSLCLSKLKSHKIDTFSIGFEKQAYNETDKAKTVANLIKSNHHEFILKEKDLENDINKIILNFDEPFADSSMLPTYLVAQKTSQDLKVALTGDGGDEVFGGYNKYYFGTLNSKYTNIVPEFLHSCFLKAANTFANNSNDNRGKRFAAKKFLNSINYQGQHYWDIISLGFTSNTINDFFLDAYKSNNTFDLYKQLSGINSPNNLTDYRCIDKLISLEGDMLVKVDRTSMLNSLECRAPFLNKKLWEYVGTLPESFLMNGLNKKYILKEAFKNKFPEGFLEKPKSGFGVPIGDWLRGSLKSELLSYADHSFLKEQQIFDIINIQKLIHDHITGKDATFKVWTFFCFQKWYVQTYNS